MMSWFQSDGTANRWARRATLEVVPCDSSGHWAWIQTLYHGAVRLVEVRKEHIDSQEIGDGVKL
jgi:hypothetical protein